MVKDVRTIDLTLSQTDIIIGLEVHRQLSGTKLFCRCDSELRESHDRRIERTLRPKLSEMGSFDQATLAQSQRKMRFIYELTDNVCAVDIDEEPPLAPLEPMIDMGIKICLLFKCEIVDSIQFMRKIVIDGSNPSGFQRTALLGFNGKLDAGDRKVIQVNSICLEEDAGRRVHEGDDHVIYRLDRLGTPEIEISTAPLMNSPDEAYIVAKKIGDILRSTGGVKRGLGSVRQDVNISIFGGSRVEIKLIQELSLIQKALRYEMMRQALSLWIVDHLVGIGISERDLSSLFSDVTDKFSGTSCRILRTGIDNGLRVMGVNLKGFRGLLSPVDVDLVVTDREQGQNEHINGVVAGLGREIALRIKLETGIKGIIHSDELPGYGMTEDELKDIGEALGTDQARDAFILVSADAQLAEKALMIALDRAKKALMGVVPEVRRALPDGVTEFMRPLPGSARMYPETDIPLITVDHGRMNALRCTLPQDPNVRISRLENETGLSASSLHQIENLEMLDVFERLAGSGSDPRMLSLIFINGIGPTIDEDMNIDLFTDTLLSSLSKDLKDGLLVREAVPDITCDIRDMLRECVDENEILKTIRGDYALQDHDLEQLDLMIDTLMNDKVELIREKGERAISPLMGLLMKDMRGLVSGSIVEKKLRGRIARYLGD